MGPAMDMSRLQQAFKERHPEQKTLEECIKADVSAIFKTGYRDTLLALLSPAKCVARELHGAVQAWYGTDDSKLIRLVAGLHRNEKSKEILARYELQDTSTMMRSCIEELKHEMGGPSLTDVKAAYLELYGNSLEDAIAGDTSFDYKNLLLALVEDQGTRDARYVQEAINNDGWVLGTNDSKLIAMLVLRTRAERAEMARAYERTYGKAVADAVKGDTSGWYAETLLSLLKPHEEALAHACTKAMKGIGTDESALIRILSYYSKKDLRDLQDAYNSTYGKSLADAVASKTSGWCAKGLM